MTLRILIANRGEIARRIQRTAHRLGHETVAAWADPDREAPFVREATTATRLGPAALAESYLSPPALIDAAKRTKADAVHPGYGFLSENADFARAVRDAGLVWVGPHPEAIARMGSKIEARRLAAEAGVPTIPGYDESQRVEDLAAAAKRIGFPVLVKAAAGGGGKGIRIVREPAALAAAIDEAKQEAARSFGDDALIVERYVEHARHVEVQIVGDAQGSVVDLGTRDCSVQRRYQKLLEEAPAPNLSRETETGLRDSARALAAAIVYDSAGTVEYVVDDRTGEFFFLEMNTRLQVEHPVTEAVTGLDLVELQLAVAAGGRLSIGQEDVRIRGHAFEARINAEDPREGYAPRTGRITALRIPQWEGVRWESGVEVGSEITPHYDAMVAKLVVAGASREAALGGLSRALDELIVGGLVTNAGFHRWLVDQPAVKNGRATTRILEEHAFQPRATVSEAAEAAARVWATVQAEGAPLRAWSAIGSFRVVPHRAALPLFLRDAEGVSHEVIPDSRAEPIANALVLPHPARGVCVNLEGETWSFELPTRSAHWGAPEAVAGAGDSDAIRSPFPAVVAETPVAAGAQVEAGDVVVVIEAMKMLHSLRAREDAVVREVHVAIGDSVDSHAVLVSFEVSGDDA